MKILIVTQYFYPENFKSNDLAFELQKRGHEVTVLTGIPNYPEGTVFSGYGFFKNRYQNINGVKVKRALLFPRGKGSGLRLFLNYYSFAFFASVKALMGSFKTRYDAIVVHEPSPIMQFYPALVLHKLQKTPVFFWVMDLWPESLEIAGGVKNKLVLNYFKKLVIQFYRNSEKILITSKGFRKSINEKGNFDDKIIYFPNWAEETVSDGDKNYTIPKLPEGFKVMFAGNVGEAQDMENVMNAAKILKDYKHIKFIIVGDGRKLNFVKNFIADNHLSETVFCFGRYPVEAMAAFFNKADVMLVSLKYNEIFNLTVPAKVQAYMSVSKPILAMISGEGADIINEAQCGLTVNAGDYKDLAKFVLEFSLKSKQELEKMGQNGKLFFRKNYRLSSCIDSLEDILTRKYQ